LDNLSVPVPLILNNAVLPITHKTSRLKLKYKVIRITAVPLLT
jgi:hypothetical protein